MNVERDLTCHLNRRANDEPHGRDRPLTAQLRWCEC